jgi:hypothetical protein
MRSATDEERSEELPCARLLIASREKKLQQAMEDRKRTDTALAYAIETRHQLAGGRSLINLRGNHLQQPHRLMQYCLFAELIQGVLGRVMLTALLTAGDSDALKQPETGKGLNSCLT